MYVRPRLRVRPRNGGIAAFTPLSLFSGGAKGAWYDPSDYSTLFQDSAGTTPVTAVEQPVGLMLDKSQGLVLGSETVLNTALNNSTNWTIPTDGTISGNALNFNNTTTVNQTFVGTTSGLSDGPRFKLLFEVFNHVSGAATILLSNGLGSQIVFPAANGVYSAIVVATSIQSIYFRAGTTGSQFSIRNITLKSLAGNHASQSTAASRPVLRARYNLLTYSEDLSNGVWLKLGSAGSSVSTNVSATTAPDGTNTADKFIVGTGSGAWYIANYSNPNIVSGQANTFSVYVKAAELGYVFVRPHNNSANFGASGFIVNLSDGTITYPSAPTAPASTGTATSAGNGWWRITCTSTANLTVTPTTGGPGIWPASSASFSSLGGVAPANFTGNGTDGIYVWGADFRTGSSAGTYQRIAAATDYATAGFLPYLAFDGTDDSFGTGSIDFSATDKMFLCAGVTKLSDANSAMVAELSANAVLNAGAFNLQAPATGATAEYRYLAGGTTSRSATATTYAAPITNVVTGLNDIVGDVLRIRVNGTQIAESLLDQGTGNFGNYALFIGRRNNSNLPLNGRIYQMVVCGKTLSAAELASTEAFVNTKTGAY